MVWNIDREPPTFNAFVGPLRVRPEGAGRARVRMVPGPQHANISGVAHGGFLLGLLDVALFAGAYAGGATSALRSTTLELSHQFAAAVRIGEPVDVIVELTRESGRLLFLRGTIEQAEAAAGAFTAILSKGKLRP